MEEHEGQFAELLNEVQGHIDHLIKETYVAPQNMMEHWSAFSSAIDWSERWIQYLLLFHVIFFLIVIITRKNVNLQTFIFFLIAILIFSSEKINGYCSENWRSFSTQNYFDKNGIFIGILFSAPLLCLCLFQLINFLSLASSSLITLKKLEHQQKKSQSTEVKKEKEKVDKKVD